MKNALKLAATFALTGFAFAANAQTSKPMPVKDAKMAPAPKMEEKVVAAPAAKVEEKMVATPAPKMEEKMVATPAPTEAPKAEEKMMPKEEKMMPKKEDKKAVKGKM